MEPVHVYRNRILDLVMLVYPDFGIQRQHQLARDFFVHGLPAEMKEKVLLSGSRDLESTVNLSEGLRNISIGDGTVEEVAVVRNRRDISCFRCGKLGHFARNCYAARAPASGNGLGCCYTDGLQQQKSSRPHASR